jgi:imidazolonepropionase-like amidohydrolase
VTINSPADDAAYQGGFRKVLEVTKLLDDEGIQLLPGTDDTTGFALLRELELYVAAGISPARTLRYATLDCERYFRRDHELGTIERGKLADFVLVDGSPRSDTQRHAQDPMIMVGSVAYYRRRSSNSVDQAFAPRRP